MARINNPVYRLRFQGCGMRPAEACRWLGIHRRTLDRQEKGETGLSGPILRALELRAGFLGSIHPDWHGWRLFQDGLLYPPQYRNGLPPGDVMAECYRSQLLAELQRQVREFNALQEQPVPSEMESILEELKEGKFIRNTGG